MGNYKIPLAVGGDGGGGAVIFDGGVPTPNARTARSENQSPIDNERQGIVNLSSDTSGAAVGAAGDFATISGGDANSVNGPSFSTVGGGQQNTIEGSSGGEGGTSGNTIGGGQENFIGANGNGATIAGGKRNLARANGATVAGGADNEARGAYSFAVGSANRVDGSVGEARGRDALSTRYGQVAFSGGMFDTRGDAQFSRYMVKAISESGAVVSLGDSSSNEFQLDIGKSYIVTIDAIAHCTNRRASRAWKKVLHVFNDWEGSQQSVIATQANLFSDNGVPVEITDGWSLTFEADTGNVIRGLFQGSAGDTVRIVATYEWTEVGTYGG